jgi:WD40 repeat protein
VLEGAAVVGVVGAGGFGKTTLVAQVCHRVRDAFPGGVLWVTVGEQVSYPALAEKINDLCELVGGARPGLTDPAAAGHRLGTLLAGCPPTLLVVDDVWAASRLAPFLRGGARVVATARSRGVLPATARVLTLDPLSPALSRSLLCLGLPGLTRTDRLVRRTGGWPILLALVNSALQRSVDDGLTPDGAADLVAEQLRVDGPDSLDLDSADRRDQAVRATVEASLRRLDPPARQRFLELSVFPEDLDIPVEVVQLLWGAGGTTPRTGRRLVRTLADLALVSVSGERIRLHDVLRAHLRQMIGADGLVEANRRLVEALRADAGGDWAGARPYSHAHLAFHAAEAGLLDALLLDAGFLLAAQPPGLLACLPETRTEAGRMAALSYRRAAHHLRDQPVAERPAYLELAARQLGADVIADGAGRLAASAPWRCAWAHWHVEAPHTVLTRHSDTVTQVAVVPRSDGRVHVVSLDFDHHLQVVDGLRNTAVDPPWRLPDDKPSAIACVALPDAGHVFVVGTAGGSVEAWHVDSGEPVTWELPAPPLPEETVDPWARANPALVVPEETIDPWDDAAPPPPASAWLSGPSQPGDFDWYAEPPEPADPVPDSAEHRCAEPPEPDDPEPGTEAYVDRLLDLDHDDPDADLSLDDWLDEAGQPPPGIERILWTPAPDGGPVVLIVRTDHTVWAVDTTTGRRLIGASGGLALDLRTPPGGDHPEATVRRGGWRHTWDLVTGLVIEDAHGIVAESPLAARLPVVNDGRLALINRSEARLVAVVDVHAGPVQAVARGRAADGRVLVATSGRDDRTVRLWEVNELIDHDRRTKPLAIERVATAGGFVATAHPDPVVRIWADGRVVRELAHERPVTALFAVTDAAGTAVLVCGADEALPRVWNLATGERIDHGLVAVSGRVVACAVTPDGVLLVTADQHNVRVWNAVDGRHRWHVPATDGRAMSLPDGRLLIVRDRKHVGIHDPLTGRCAGPSTSVFGTPIMVGAHADTDPPVAAFISRSVNAWDPVSGTYLASTRLSDANYDTAFRRHRHGGAVVANDAVLVRLADRSAVAAIGGPVLRLLRLEPNDGPVPPWPPPKPYKWTKMSDVHLDTPVTALAVDDGALVVGTARGLARLRLYPPVS